MADNITWHPSSVTREERWKNHGHRGATLWFTGLSGSGKSTLANAVARKLYDEGVSTYVLDGDNVRHGLCKDLSFTQEDREENIRRIGEVAKLFTDSGLIVMAAFVSPYRKDRDIAAQLQPDDFHEIYVKADVETCAERDPKGLYKKAFSGEIKHFTGVDDPYEEPINPAVVANTAEKNLVECTDLVLEYLRSKDIIG